MNKQNSLPNEFCPDGVEFKTIDELIKRKVIKIISPSIKIKKNDFLNFGTIPIISQEQKYISGYTNVSDNKILEDEYVCFGDHSEHIKYVNFKFVQGADGLKILAIEQKEQILPKYLYYSVSNYYVKYNNYERHFKYFRQIEIPVPPLHVQEEIVRILDNFTELTAELKAELTARKKQYEYYQNLVFKIGNSNAFFLEDIAMVKARIGWQGLTKKEYLPNGFALLVTGIDFKNGKIDFKNCHYVTKDRYEQDKNIQLMENDILVTKDGTLGKMAYVKDLPQNATLNSGVFVIRVKEKDKVLPRYLYHYLNSGKLMNYAKSKLTGGTIKHLNQNVVVKTPVILPSLQEQQRIVDILDRFDKLCNDITEGLPAEIEARQKQYEYYRDKLLTFKPLEEVK